MTANSIEALIDGANALPRIAAALAGARSHVHIAGWHVEADSVTGEQTLGGRHFHVKVRESDSGARVSTNGVYTEFFDPDVFVSQERITGDPGIDPDVPLELRVEFNQTGRDGTLLRIIQGPYEPDVAGWHGEAWEKELVRLQEFLVKSGRLEAMS